MKNYMHTTDFLNMAEYFVCGLRNDYKFHLEKYKEVTVALLQEIDKSNFK